MEEELNIKLLKTRYAHVKLVLKKWESAYKKEHGEKPSKEALHMAPVDIKDSYKTYYRLAKHLSRIKKGQVNINDVNIESSENSNFSFSDCKISNNSESVLDEKTNNCLLSRVDSDFSSSQSSSLDIDSSKINSDTLMSSRSSSITDNSFKIIDKASSELDSNSQSKISPNKDLKGTTTISVSNTMNNEMDKTDNSSLKPSVWGTHLNKIKLQKNEPVNFELSLYSKMAEKMKSHAVIKTRTSLKRITSKIFNKEKEKVIETTIQNKKKENSLKDDNILNDNFNDEDLFLSPNKQNENIINAELNGPKLCVIKKGSQKIDSKSVNHFSLNNSTESRIVNRRWNNNWVERCMEGQEEEIIFPEHKIFPEIKTTKEVASPEMKENFAENRSLINEAVSFNVNDKIESKSNANIEIMSNFNKSVNIVHKNNDKVKTMISFNKNDSIVNEVNDKLVKNNNCNLPTEDLTNPTNKEDPIDERRNISSENTLKRKLSEREVFESNEAKEDVFSTTLPADDEDLFAFENEKEYQPNPKRKKVMVKKKATKDEVAVTNVPADDEDENIFSFEDEEEYQPKPKTKKVTIRKKATKDEIASTNVPADDKDKDVSSFEDEEYQTKPKRKKVTVRKKATYNSKRKTISSKEKSEAKSNTRPKRVKPDKDTKVVCQNLSNEKVDENILPKYDELQELGNGPGNSITNSRRYFSKEERLNFKVENGKLNDNFVKINLKKKVFVRGKRRMTSEKYKRMEWKNKQIEKKAVGGDERAIKKLTCHRCGEFGHWANKCTGKGGDKLMSLDAFEQESTFLTLEEASNLAKGLPTSNESIPVTKVYKNDDQTSVNSEDEIFSDWDDDFLTSVEASEKNTSNNDKSTTNIPNKNIMEINENTVPSIHPIYKLDSDGNVIPTSFEVKETLDIFGHKLFRKGQETVIMRILSGLSTLVVQSTGSGKSLCYQLPAYIYSKHFNCITLCVSPLVSLMEDQVTGLPTILKAVCLHTQQSPANREKAMNSLKAGDVHILLVSPEAIVSSRGGGVLGTLLKELPPIAFACLDEAHCLSEWSHNFRPSYLQVCQILKERFHVNTFLGLTATARNETAMSIARHLQIPSLNQGIIMGGCIPDNLVLSVSRDAKREEALIHLLTGDRFESCLSIIIYCTRRDECERIATFIRTQMLTASKIDVKSNSKRNKGFSLDAEAYHAGLSGFRRQQIQKRFMSGKLRIVVATVAFGMGIDKADVQGIIHFNMPRNLESYVQEIGRAGRDGNPAHCHLFLDNSEGKDIQELKRHIFVNSVDRHIVRKLLNKIFAHQNCVKVTKLLETPNESMIADTSLATQHCDMDNISDDKEKQINVDPSSLKILCPGHEVALPINDLIESLDLPEENIQTLLCYMEMHSKCRLQLSHHAYATSSISCYGGAKQLCAFSKKCPPLAVAIALQRKQGKNFNKLNSITFPVVEISSQMGWNSRIVKQELKNLEWINNGLGFKPSGVKVEFSDLSFHMTGRCDLTDEEQDQILEDIYERACKQEKDQLKQLQYTYEVLCKASHSSIILCCDQVDEEKSVILKEKIRNYFSFCNDGGIGSIQLEEQLYIRPEVEQRIRQDIRSMLSIHSDQSWTGRAVARVLHGIASPNFPSKVWGRVRKFWRLHLETDFNLLVGIATKEILKFR